MANSFPGSGLVYVDQLAVGRSSGTSLINSFLADDLNTIQIRAESNTSGVVSYTGIAPAYLEYYRNTSTGVDLIIQTKIQASGGGGAIVFSPNSPSADLTPVERMRITKAGRVGIGASSPAYQLEIGGTGPTIGMSNSSATGYNEIYFNRNTSTTMAYIGVGVNSTVTANGDEFVIQNNVSTGNLVFRTNNSGTIAERMRITSAGVVQIKVPSSANQGILFKDVADISRAKVIYDDISGEMTIGTMTSYSTVFVTNDAEKMRITTTGNVGIGTSSPSQKLHVNGTSQFDDTLNFATRGKMSWGGSPAKLILTSSGSYNLALATDDFVDRMTIQASTGNVGINTNSPGTYKLNVNGTFYSAGSSLEYKTEISTLDTDTNKILELRPVTYQYKDEYKHLGKELKSGTQIGLIAEEVAEVFPELALLKQDEDGEIRVRNVDYEKLSILLLSEVQKLRKEVNELKNK